ncbi:hypothetical protein [Marinobacter lutaoensis]|jgi:hypothetical protein|uniref:Uncharacterized protein n=1 Tax=Marinobacter lutaoensis TaxID=135739 RepID=A0A1V2DNV7_9GAMM|nr:hypothetical protein [Marinobacter lutaoensis]MBI43412.1 hypothetical protein [Oceanospirillales bacterium]NVD36018.1 hypothetical protein [Marinobacter lutaoensis]ONF42303.1 hypothetical protein BTO32_16050 [Marinobacter lutaoensis]|tara:strand:- start:3077 stop:3613 length:537 start_codon:yes stop_codon:yes gene_type:complete
MEPEQHGWASLPKALKTSLLSAAVMLAALVLINLPLQTDSAPQGIVSFQLAVTADQAHDILNSWHSAGHLWAQTSLWLDFVFITTYLMALLHLTRFLMRDRPGIRERKVARWVRSLFITAGLGDVAENILLLNNFNPPTDLVSLAATVCALIKFTGLTLGLAGLVVIRAARRHPLPLG